MKYTVLVNKDNKLKDKLLEKINLITTKNELDEDGCIITYAYQINPKKKDNNLYPIETDEEYEFIV